MTLRRINRETDTERRMTPDDVGGASSACAEVHGLSWPGLSNQNAGTFGAIWQLPLVAGEDPVPFGIQLNAFATAAEAQDVIDVSWSLLGTSEPAPTAEDGPLPSELTIRWNGGLSTKRIPLPALSAGLTGPLRPLPMARRVSSAG